MRVFVRLPLLIALAGLVGCGDNSTEPRGPGFTIVSQNILLGAFCDAGTDGCRLEDRVDLFFEFVEDRGCPDVLALQEASPNIVAAVERNAATAECPFAYEVLPAPSGAQLLVTRYPALAVEQTTVHGGIRNVLYASIDHPLGAVDVFTTHLAAGIDLGSGPCGDACPTECVSAGAETNRECQAVQVARLVDAMQNPDTPTVLTGDMNARPGSFVYDQFVGRGWIDTYEAAGNPECAPETGVGCTSGREDSDLSDLESSELGVRSRIDYVFLVSDGATGGCAGSIEAPDEGFGTRLFGEEPNPFAPACGARPNAVCWPSDHVGMQLGLRCG